MQQLGKNQKLARAAMLMAVTVLLAVTPLGYVRINVLEITLMVVPVAVGGMVMGWPVGGFLGLVFGITSFIKAFADPLGIIMLGQNALLAGLGCVLPRLAVGLLADALHRVLKRHEELRRVWFYALGGFLCSLCNTVLFLGFIWLVFDTAVTGLTLGVIMGVVASNGIFEMLANAVLVAALVRLMIPAGKGKTPPAPPPNGA